MTDARLRGEWLNALKFDDLSDTAWRVFTGALMWSAENGTNGRIPDRYMKMLHPDGSKPDASQELVNAGLWEVVPGAFRLIDWDGALGQSTAEQVETYKANGRKRARTYREGQRQKLARVVGFVDTEGVPVTRDVASDVMRDVREYVGKGEGTGKGSGYVSTNSDEQLVNHNTGEVEVPKASTGWPVVEIPNSTPSSPSSCTVSGCSNQLVSPESQALGVCRKGGAAHEKARSSAAA